MHDTLLVLEAACFAGVQHVRTWRHAHWFVHWYQWQSNQPLSAAESSRSRSNLHLTYKSRKTATGSLAGRRLSAESSAKSPLSGSTKN